MLDITVLKDFIDLGGTFILALVLCFGIIRKLDSIEDKQVKILTLLTVLTKVNTNFNGIEGVLGKDGDKVAQTILEAETKENK